MWQPNKTVSVGSNQGIMRERTRYLVFTEAHLAKKEEAFGNHSGKRGAAAKGANKIHWGAR